MKTFLSQSKRKTLAFMLLSLMMIGVSYAQRTSLSSGNWSAAGTWVNVSTNRTGTVTSSTASTTVTGSGSALFLTELSVGSIITTQGGIAIGTVASIASNTSLTLTANASNTVSGQTYRTTGGPPSPNDAVTIDSNHNVTVNGVFACASLNIGNGGNKIHRG